MCPGTEVTGCCEQPVWRLGTKLWSYTKASSTLSGPAMSSAHFPISYTALGELQDFQQDFLKTQTLKILPHRGNTADIFNTKGTILFSVQVFQRQHDLRAKISSLGI